MVIGFELICDLLEPLAAGPEHVSILKVVRVGDLGAEVSHRAGDKLSQCFLLVVVQVQQHDAPITDAEMLTGASRHTRVGVAAPAVLRQRGRLGEIWLTIAAHPSAFRSSAAAVPHRCR
jgi:hypothetical protein